MACEYLQISVLFEDPFWMCILERQSSFGYEVCKVIFGAEPKDYEVYDFFLNSYYGLKFSKASAVDVIINKKTNPKRMQREIRKSLETKGVGTKAQNALKMQYEQSKADAKVARRENREKYKKEQLEKKRLRKIEKHKGH